jgi:HSP20 family protein
MTTLTLRTRRDPFADFDAAVTGIMRRAFAPTARSTHRAHSTAGFVPAAELLRDGEDAVVRLELPGLDVANDVNVEIDRGRLVVKGERRDERTENGSGWREVRYGSFRRSFGLPEHVGADAVSASYDAGVLTVRVAGAYAAQEPTAQRIAVTAAPAVSVAATQDAPDAQSAEIGTSEESGEQHNA